MFVFFLIIAARAPRLYINASSIPADDWSDRGPAQGLFRWAVTCSVAMRGWVADRGGGGGLAGPRKAVFE